MAAPSLKRDKADYIRHKPGTNLSFFRWSAIIIALSEALAVGRARGSTFRKWLWISDCWVSSKYGRAIRNRSNCRPERPRRCLAMLAAKPDTRHRRDHLAGVLWPQSDSKQARGSLRQTLNLLRKALGEKGAAAVCATGDDLWLDPSGASIDTQLFETGASAATAAVLEQACAHYRGDFLEGLEVEGEEFEDWRMAERMRLREIAIAAMSRLLEQHVNRRRRREGDCHRREAAVAGFDLRGRLPLPHAGLSDPGRARRRHQAVSALPQDPAARTIGRSLSGDGRPLSENHRRRRRVGTAAGAGTAEHRHHALRCAAGR